MNKILVSIKYKSGYYLIQTSWYLAIYVIVMLMIFYPLIKLSVIDSSSGSLVYRIWGAAIFLFAVSMKFKEDFDFLLTLSNTRNEIFYSLLGPAIGFSAGFSGLITLERVIVDRLNNAFAFYNITDPFHFFAPYRTDSLYLQFVYFFLLCACCSLFGLLMGSLFYRFGKKFTTLFWLVFSAVFMIAIPALVWNFYLHGILSSVITATGELLKNFDVWNGSGYLLIVTIAFGTATYLNIRRLPQK